MQFRRKRQERRSVRFAAPIIAGCCLLLSQPTATAQPAQIPRMDVEIKRVSGLIDNKVNEGEAVDPNRARLVYSTTVKVENAPWIRVFFGEVQLSGSMRNGNASYVVISSVLDKAIQQLNPVTLAQWRNTSAYFNGDAVVVDLYAYPNTGDNRLDIDHVSVGLPGAEGGGPESQCGPTDDRAASSDDRVGRIMPVGCTGFLISEADHCALTAGHCANPAGDLDVLQFNVPLSTAGGTPVNPPPSDQYAINQDAIQFVDGGEGNDWCYFSTFNNAVTGLSPRDAQGAAFTLAAAAPAPDNSTIRVTGYGVDAGSANQTQQTETGIYDTLVGTSIRYNDLDTEGGNSGSPIIRDSSQLVYGIHTHGFCTTAGGGYNAGTAIQNAGLQAALDNPEGACSAAICPGSGNCYAVHATPGCSNAACCALICQADPFCCEVEWDNFCVGAAVQDCGNCGDPTAGSCYVPDSSVGCDNLGCCSAVCAADPFCCNTEWDSLCAERAAEICTLQNDVCAASTQVFDGDQIFGDLTTATNDGQTTCGTSSTNADAWYLFSASSAGQLTVDTCGTHDAKGVDSGMDTVLSLHSACPGTAGNTLLCNDDAAVACTGDSGSIRDSRVSLAMIAGQTVRIRVSHFSTMLDDGEFRINVNFSKQNNACASAAPVFDGQTVSGDLDNESNDGQTTCGSSSSNPDQWYLFTATHTGQLIAETCGTHDANGTDNGMDTVLSVHSACPGTAANTLACNDDALPACSGDAGSIRDSRVTLNMTAGQAVRIRVSHFNTAIANGQFSLSISFLKQNNSCANAVTVVDGSTIVGDLNNETNDGQTTCGSSNSNPDLWYVFTAPTIGTLTADTCGTHDAPGADQGMDTVISLHSACPGTAANTLACNDDASPACAGDAGQVRDSRVSLNVTSGQIVRIRVSHFSAVLDDGAFVLHIGFQPSCGNPDAGNCYAVHPTPFCNDADCCQTVCAIDPFCCNNSWDQQCVNEAAELCGNCGDPAAGDCFVANGTVGCDISSCCAAVCAIDPYCCNTEWDGICAAEADDMCVDPCAADVAPPPNGDGVVNVTDLLAIVANWGACPGCPADCSPQPAGDGQVNVSDLLLVVSQWGTCP